VFFWANFHNLTNIFKNEEIMVLTNGWGNKNSNKMQIEKDTFLFLYILRNWLNMFQLGTLIQKDNIWILKLLYLNQFTWIMVTNKKWLHLKKRSNLANVLSFFVLVHREPHGWWYIRCGIKKCVYQCWVVLIFVFVKITGFHSPNHFKEAQVLIKKSKKTFR
jgi:hypothetical protein